jgi:hypothetical protein
MNTGEDDFLTDASTDWIPVHDARKLANARRTFLSVWLGSIAGLLTLIAIGLWGRTQPLTIAFGGSATFVALAAGLRRIADHKVSEASAVEYSATGLRSSVNGRTRVIAWTDVSGVEHQGPAAQVYDGDTRIPVFAEYMNVENGAAEFVRRQLREWTSTRGG